MSTSTVHVLGWTYQLRTCQYILVHTVFYGPTTFFIKASILVLYLRIFSPLWRVKLLIYLGIAIILLTNATISILFAALCTPRNGQLYTVQYNTSQCFENATNLTLASAIVNFISDLYLLLLPLPLVWNLQLTRKRRLGIIAIFMTGILYTSLISALKPAKYSFRACISSLVSIVIRALWGHDPDYTWWAPRVVFTRQGHSLVSVLSMLSLISLSEMNIGIICASMPACAAVFRRSSYPTKTRSWITKSTKQSSSKQTVLKRQPPYSNDSAQGDFYPYQGHYLELEEAHTVMHSHSKLQPQIVDV